MKSLIFLSFFISFSVFATDPEVEWETANAEQVRLDLQILNQAFDYAFDPNQPFQTNALLVIKDGKLIKEQYANDTNEETPHRIWSCTKSFVGALYGIAFRRKLLTEDTTVASFFYHLDKRLTVSDLLMMASGLDWNEGYESNPLLSKVIRMLYTEGFDDTAKYVSHQSQIYSPGKHFRYSSGETNLLMGFLKEALGKQNFHLFPWIELFKPLQMKNVTWEMDQSGTYIGSSYLYMRARDFAKLGQLYLNKGKWKGVELIEENYIKKSLTPNPAFLQTKLEGVQNRASYGLHWWLNVDLPEKNEGRIYPDVPSDAFFAQGHHGQTLAVIPSKNMIIVRYGSDKKKIIDRNLLVSKILKAVKE
ncbi:MAG: serine hydrolase [Bacteriovoracaceae bacterium]